MRREMRTLLGEQKEATTRGLADLDARINFNKTRMHDLEEKLEARVAAVSILFTYMYYVYIYICRFHI